MTFALLGGGRIRDSFVARLPHLSRDLGPVAAHSYRVASRIVNLIRAGRAVARLEDLHDARVVLICVPPERVAATVSRLGPAMDWSGRIVLYCGAGASSDQFQPLRLLGAAAGSVQPGPCTHGELFVTEGDPSAIRAASRLLASLNAHVEVIETAKVDLYLAALSLGSSLFTPVLEAATSCLTVAGLRRRDAERVTEALFSQSLRAHQYSGRRSWSGPLAYGDLARVQRELRALERWSPEVAAYYRDAARLADKVLGKPIARASERNARAAQAS
jgi:predicted short-subunit dehydrogenase-like oxidoreductase (DUF2520 family)